MNNTLVDGAQDADLKTMLPVPVASPQHRTLSGGQFLTFSLHEEMYGLDILRVREIIGYTRPTAVPMMPRFVRGVINLRGQIVPILDLSMRFGWPATDLHVRTCIVVMEIQGQEDAQLIGVLVDAVNTVLELEAAEIEPAPKFGAAVHSDFILGMAKLDKVGFVTLLDPGRVFSSEEMAALAQPENAASD